MDGGGGASDTYTHSQHIQEGAQKWLTNLHLQLEGLVSRTPPDVDKVAISFAQQLEVLLEHIAILEHFLGEGEDSPTTARARTLVENTLGN